MNYYAQYKRSAEQFYRTYGSLNSAREVRDVLRTERQRDPNLHYIWASYQSPPAMPANREQQPSGQPLFARAVLKFPKNHVTSSSRAEHRTLRTNTTIMSI